MHGVHKRLPVLGWVFEGLRTSSYTSDLNESERF